MNDESIISGIKKRKGEFLESFLEKYGCLIRAVVRRHLSGLEDMQEECINDILFAVWQNIDRFDPAKNSLKNWVCAIAKYRCIDYKRRAVNAFKTENIDDVSIAEEMKTSLEEDIDELLCALPKADRQLFYRRYILGETAGEIATAMKVSPGLIYNRMSRAKKRLRRQKYEK